MDNAFERAADMVGAIGIHASKEETKTTEQFDFRSRCDPGFSGDFCQISNLTLLNRGVFLQDNQTELMAHQGRSLILQTVLFFILY